jgi:hypothetical protein
MKYSDSRRARPKIVSFETTSPLDLEYGAEVE